MARPVALLVEGGSTTVIPTNKPANTGMRTLVSLQMILAREAFGAALPRAGERPLPGVRQAMALKSRALVKHAAAVTTALLSGHDVTCWNHKMATSSIA